MKQHLKFVLGFLTAAVLLAQVQQPALSPTICQGRLTLTTATPVTTADVTAATSVLFTPYTGNRCPVFDSGGGEIDRTFAELSIAVPATTSTMYDVWLFDNSGVFALEVLPWTNDTTRATALTTQGGVLVKTGAITRRYLGSFRTTAVSGQTEDSVTKRFVWNYYNRVRRPVRIIESTASWAGTNNSTPRQLNGNAANQVDMVVGFNETPVWVTVNLAFTEASGTGFAHAIGVGVDSTTTMQAGISGGTQSTGSAFTNMNGAGWLSLAVGRHFLAVLEESQTAGTVTFYGSGTGSFFANTYQPGLEGWIEG